MFRFPPGPSFLDHIVRMAKNRIFGLNQSIFKLQSSVIAQNVRIEILHNFVIEHFSLKYIFLASKAEKLYFGSFSLEFGYFQKFLAKFFHFLTCSKKISSIPIVLVIILL